MLNSAGIYSTAFATNLVLTFCFSLNKNINCTVAVAIM